MHDFERENSKLLTESVLPKPEPSNIKVIKPSTGQDRTPDPSIFYPPFESQTYSTLCWSDSKTVHSLACVFL